MSVNQTSLQAYYNEIIPIRGLRQLEVLKALETPRNALENDYDCMMFTNNNVKEEKIKWQR